VVITELISNDCDDLSVVLPLPSWDMSHAPILKREDDEIEVRRRYSLYPKIEVVLAS
jgi:hypothetical protein